RSPLPTVRRGDGPLRILPARLTGGGGRRGPGALPGPLAASPPVDPQRLGPGLPLRRSPQSYRESSPGARGARTAAACGPEGRCFAPVFVERRSSHSRGRVARCHRKGGRGALTTLSRDVSAGEARASFVRPGGRGPGCVRQGGGDEHGSCPRGAPEAARRVVRLSRPWRSVRARPP